MVSIGYDLLCIALMDQAPGYFSLVLDFVEKVRLRGIQHGSPNIVR